ncbi:MAG: hypothetical protein ACHQEM_02820 [Chitinophagales bacterium]
MKKLLRLPLFFLVLLPAFFLLHNYNELFGFIPGKLMLWSSLVIFASIFIFYFLVKYLVASAEKSSLLLFIISCFVLFFRPVHGLAVTLAGRSILSSYKIFLPISVAILVIVCLKIIRTKIITAKTIVFLNTTMLCIFFIEIGDSLVKYRVLQRDRNLIYPSTPICDSYLPGKVPDSLKPDIYFLVFDEYTNNETLKKIWKFNNDSIIHWLAQKGFYIPANARANYDFTPYSISSTFNMNWLDEKKGQDATSARNVLQANQSMSDNELFCILKKEKYNIQFLAPFRNSIQDDGLGAYFDYLPEGQIFRQTLFGSLVKDISWKFRSKDKEFQEMKESAKEFSALNQKLIGLIKRTADSTSTSLPKFVYGHFMITHEPHIFDSEGRIELTNPDSPAFNTYTKEVAYANLVIRDLVDFVFNHNKSNTIFIIEGDHGFRRLPEALDAFRFPNLMAIYFPGPLNAALPSTISPVNLFRLILNHSFQQNLTMLPDSSVLVNQ